MTNLFYRIGSAAEGKYFEEMKKYYYGIVINANLVTLYSNWIPSLVQKLKKPFFINPVTYILSLDLENIKKNGDVKKSFEKLIRLYSSKIKEIVIDKERELLPEDFIKNGKWNQSLIEDFIKNVFSLQKNVDTSQFQQTLSEILEIMGKEIKIERHNLLFLVPPYFYFDSINDPWYKITLHLAKTSLKFKEGYGVYPTICISKEIILDKNSINKIFNDYKEFDGFIIWISELNEREDDEKYLNGLYNLVKTFANAKKPIIILHGEFLSLLLSKKYNLGYVRNICYGEHKNIETPPVGGPLPQRRYYLNFTHSKVPESKARVLFSLHRELLCKCDICSRIQYKTIEEFFNNLENTDFNKHFMVIHNSEVKLTGDQLKNRLIQNYSLCKNKKIENLGIKYKHLEKWISIANKMQL